MASRTRSCTGKNPLAWLLPTLDLDTRTMGQGMSCQCLPGILSTLDLHTSKQRGVLWWLCDSVNSGLLLIIATLVRDQGDAVCWELFPLVSPGRSLPLALCLILVRYLIHVRELAFMGVVLLGTRGVQGKVLTERFQSAVLSALSLLVFQGRSCSAGATSATWRSNG